MSKRPLSDSDVRRCLAASIELAGGQRAWARQHGLQQSHVGKLVAGRRALTPRVLSVLGLRQLPPAYEPMERRQ